MINKFLLNRILLFILLFSSYIAISQSNPPITPKWALGHVVWEDSLNTRQSAEMLLNLYKKNNIPVSGIIIDSPWSMSYNDFNWDTERYPEPEQMITNFNKNGVKVILWITGALNISARDVPIQKSPDYDFVIENKYVVNQGKPSEWWKGEGVHLDFTNPEAVKWWNSKLDKVFKKGVYGWKVDQAEYYFADSISMLDAKLGQDNMYFGDTLTTSIGRISIRDFKYYYYDNMYDYTQKKNPEAIILARPFSHQGEFAASINKLSLGWSGDFKGNYEGLKLQIANIYTSAAAGYGALACEVGGFYEEKSTKNQLIRYAQFGAMTTNMINGGQNGPFTNHLPWYHDEETNNIYRYYVNLHYQLVPYIFSTLVDAHLYGSTLLKETSIEKFSHKLGNDLFFKALISDDNTAEITLPKDDEWIDFWSGKTYSGGSAITQTYELKKAPLFIRSGAIIPLEISNDITQFGDSSFAGKNTILIYPNEKSQYTFHKPLGKGKDYRDIEINYDNANGLLSVKGEKEDNFIFLIKKKRKPKKVKGSDTWSYDNQEGFLKIEKSGDNFKINIK